MAKENITQLSLRDVESPDNYAISNFIFTNSANIPGEFSLDNPIIFDGIILGLCVKGKGSVRINFQDYELEENTIIAVLPKHIFNVAEKKSDDFIVETLFFSFDFVAGLPFPNDLDVFMHMGKCPCVKVSEMVMDDLLNHHTFIVNQYNKNIRYFKTQVMRSLVYSLLLKMGSIYKEENTNMRIKSSRQEELAAKFFELLIKYYATERSVNFYADKMCVTSKYLSLIIKNVTGLPALKWIHEIVITEAKMRLKSTDQTIFQISEELNFPNPSFFGKYFKLHTGSTPLKFRNDSPYCFNINSTRG